MVFPNKKLFLDIIIVSLLMAGILFFQGSGRDVKAGTNDFYQNIEVFTEVLRQIEKNYVEP